MQAARSTSSVGSVGSATSHDETTQAVKRRKLEQPQHTPLSAEADTVGSDREDRVDRTVVGQVRFSQEVYPRSSFFPIMLDSTSSHKVSGQLFRSDYTVTFNFEPAKHTQQLQPLLRFDISAVHMLKRTFF